MNTLYHELPSFGSWATYALGSENDELPSFVALMIARTARSGKNTLEWLARGFSGTDRQESTRQPG